MNILETSVKKSRFQVSYGGSWEGPSKMGPKLEEERSENTNVTKAFVK